MIKQLFILFAVAALALALGDGKTNFGKKNTFQAQSQYPSVTSFHSKKGPSSAQMQPEPQAAPSPYAFTYDADGSSRQESSDASGKVKGSYKVTNEDGSIRVVNYVADENGFRADIDTNEPGTKSDNPADVTLKSAAVEKQFKAPQRQTAQRFSQKTTKTHVQQQPIQFTMGNNGYSYNYESKLDDGGSSAQRESSDGSGQVTGYYSMSAADGRNRQVDYAAGSAGFTAQVKTNEFGTRSDSPADVQFMSSAAQQQGPAANGYRQASSVQQRPQMRHQAAVPFKQERIQQNQFSDSKPVPYSFSYDAQLEDGSSSRSESSDESGKVTGSYTVVGADGRKRIINYEADHEGFRAKVDTNEFGTKSDSPANVQFHSSAPQEAPATRMYAASGRKTAPSAALPLQQSRWSSGSSTKTAYQAPTMYQGQSSIQYNAPADAKPQPYSFNYQADLDDGSISRSESADGTGKVVGQYSMSVADGRQRTVDYLADHEGFRATVNTNEFGTKEESPADVQFYSSATFDEPAPYSSPNAQRAASSASMYSSSRVQQQPIQFNMGTGNGIYSYNYESSLEDGGSNAHSESADGSGKVSGYYSMSNAEGMRRKVDYTAGSEGFQASVDTNEFGTKSDSPAHVTFHSSARQAAPEAPRSPMAYAVPAAQRASGSAGMYKASHATKQRAEPVQSFQPSPYAFNYEAEASGGSSSRQESSDASGVVTGSYEVRNEDGSVRVVEYIADENGFRANVKTNEAGTKSDHPADVVFKSDAAAAPVEQEKLRAVFPAATHTRKTSELSQRSIDVFA